MYDFIEIEVRRFQSTFVFTFLDMTILFMFLKFGTWQQLRRGLNNMDDEGTHPQHPTFLRRVDPVYHPQHELACPLVV